MATLTTLLSLLFASNIYAARNLLKNGDLESTNYSGNWGCLGGACTLAPSQDSFSGSHSMKVSNRHHDYEGPSQNVQVTPNQHYNFTAYIKLLNTAPGHKYQSAQATMACKDSHGKTHYFSFGNTPYIQPRIWTEVGGIHKIPNGYHSCFAYLQVKGAAVNFLFDQANLQLVPNNPHWKADAQARIEQIRKADITVRLASGGHVSQNTYIELKQTRHEFAFGSVVGARQIVDQAHKKYQDFFYDNFEWAVLENALKWRPMEPTRGAVNYNTPLNAINALRAKGIKVRGHNVFWAVDQWVQNWVKALSKQDLLQAMSERIKGVIGHTKGLVEHWDVNNEDLHGDFYERHTGNPNITMEMFREISSVDPQVKLFLNDYAIMARDEYNQNATEAEKDDNKATALKDQAKLFKDAQVPIYGVGIQSHIYNAHLDITQLKARLDKVAEAGLPIWITELTLSEKDENLKATGLTDLLTLYFSHPAVEGVLLWGFWDGLIWLDESKLAEGPNVTANAAGRAYQKLFKETWRTHMTRNVANHHPIHVRGFKGDYTVNIKQNGHVIKSEQFTLGKNGVSLEIHLPNQGQPASVIVG